MQPFASYKNRVDFCASPASYKNQVDFCASYKNQELPSWFLCEP